MADDLRVVREIGRTTHRAVDISSYFFFQRIAVPVSFVVARV